MAFVFAGTVSAQVYDGHIDSTHRVWDIKFILRILRGAFDYGVAIFIYPK